VKKQPKQQNASAVFLCRQAQFTRTGQLNIGTETKHCAQLLIFANYSVTFNS
jgi:hypothetical protein